MPMSSSVPNGVTMPASFITANKSTPDPKVPVYVNGQLTVGQTPPLTAGENCAPGAAP
jgi:hypothetical protein